jgi:hypothetical protein
MIYRRRGSNPLLKQCNTLGGRGCRLHLSTNWNMYVEGKLYKMFHSCRFQDNNRHNEQQFQLVEGMMYKKSDQYLEYRFQPHTAGMHLHQWKMHISHTHKGCSQEYPVKYNNQIDKASN